MKHLLALLATSLLVISCTKDNTTTPEPAPLKTPGVGSTFSYAGYAIDITGSKIPDTDNQHTETVVASNISFQGKTGVWAIDNGSSDTLMYCLDRNNDLLMYVDESDGMAFNNWVRLPISTGTTFTDSATSTEDYQGVPVQILTRFTSMLKGEESVTVGSESIRAVKILFTVSGRASIAGQTISDIELVTTLWYAPSLGNFIKAEQPATEIKAKGEIQDGFTSTLKSYSLK